MAGYPRLSKSPSGRLANVLTRDALVMATDQVSSLVSLLDWVRRSIPIRGLSFLLLTTLSPEALCPQSPCIVLL